MGLFVVTTCAALFASACALLVDLDAEQCQVDSDCTGRGAAFDGMTCANHVCRPQPKATSTVVSTAEAGVAEAAAPPRDPLGCVGSSTHVSPDPSKLVHVELPIIDLGTGRPLLGATIKLCSRSDIGCTTPRKAGLVPDATSGIVDVEVESGFSGYFEVTGPNVQSSLYVVNPPAVTSRRLEAWQVVSPLVFGYLAHAASSTIAIDPMLGHLLIGVRDCFYAPLAGNVLVPDRIDPKGGTTGFYMVDDLPDVTKTSTSAQGAGGFINMPVGFMVVTSKGPSGQTIATANILVRAGFLSYATITPAQ